MNCCKDRNFYLIPLSYWYCSRLRKIVKREKNKLRSILFEMALLGIPIWWFYSGLSLVKTINFIIFYLIVLAILYSIYEAGYIINDVWAVKREDNPTYREEAKYLSFKTSIATRLVFAALVSYIMVVYEYTEKYYVITAYVLLLIAIIVYNIVNIKAWRYHTFFALRTAKYLFAPLIIFSDVELAFLVFLATIPLILNMMAQWYFSRVAGQDKNVIPPQYIAYGVFLPFQILLAGPYNIPAYMLNILLFVSGILKARHYLR